MSDLTVWCMPDQKGYWILRSPSGKLWAMPNIARAWERGLRFLLTRDLPTIKPVGPETALVVAAWLGVPGYATPSASARTLSDVECMSELLKAERDLLALAGLEVLA